MVKHHQYRWEVVPDRPMSKFDEGDEVVFPHPHDDADEIGHIITIMWNDPPGEWVYEILDVDDIIHGGFTEDQLRLRPELTTSLKLSWDVVEESSPMRGPKGAVWWHNAQGQLHRFNGPAIERPDGYRAWYQNDRLHRVDGPAIERADGSRDWYLYGQLHRVDGPAVEYADGSKEWWQNDKRHRLDGPAIDWSNGTKRWFIAGQELTEEQFNQRIHEASLKFAWDVELDDPFPTAILKSVSESLVKQAGLLPSLMTEGTKFTITATDPNDSSWLAVNAAWGVGTLVVRHPRGPVLRIPLGARAFVYPDPDDEMPGLRFNFYDTVGLGNP